MYRRHKILLLVCFGGIFLIAFFFNWEFYAVAEAAITVASIAMGVYIAAVSALLGSQYTLCRALLSNVLFSCREKGFHCSHYLRF